MLSWVIIKTLLYQGNELCTTTRMNEWAFSQSMNDTDESHEHKLNQK